MSGATLCRGIAASLALGLAAILFTPGASQAAIVTGSNSVATPAGSIDFTVTIDDALTIVSIEWPENRWVGLNFESSSPLPPATTTDPHTNPTDYAIVSEFDLSRTFEANLGGFVITPQELGEQDVMTLSSGTASGRHSVTVQRANDTGDPNDFQFEAVEQYLVMSWALGRDGRDTTVRHDFRDYTSVSLSLVPIPAALPLLATALVGLGFLARRRAA